MFHGAVGLTSAACHGAQPRGAASDRAVHSDAYLNVVELQVFDL